MNPRPAERNHLDAALGPHASSHPMISSSLQGKSQPSGGFPTLLSRILLHPLQYSRDCKTVLCVLNLRASSERQMGLPTGRMEKRSARAVAVELSRPDLSHAPETTFTENVSLHGVRVVTNQRWRVGDRPLVKYLEGDFQSQAQVMYCQLLPNNALAVGLKLFTRAEEWGSPFSPTAAREQKRGDKKLRAKARRQKLGWKRRSKFRT